VDDCQALTRSGTAEANQLADRPNGIRCDFELLTVLGSDMSDPRRRYDDPLS